MRFSLKPLLAIVPLVVFVGCVGRAPVQGWIYTGVTSGLAVSAQAGPKMGEACASSILGIIATGDASIDTARRNGGITSISIVDEKTMSILGIYVQHCTIVHGK